MLDVTIRPHILDLVCGQYYSLKVCQNLTKFPEENIVVQGKAGTYLIIYRILIYVPSLTVSLFCGAWSDKYGRTLLMVLPNIGSIAAVLALISSHFFEQSTALIIVYLGTFIQGSFGKLAVITIAVNSYTAESTTSEARTAFLGRLLAMQYFGKGVGALLSGVMEFDMMVLFEVASGIHLLVILLAVFGIKQASVDISKQTKDKAEQGHDLKCGSNFLRDMRALLKVLIQKIPGVGRYLAVCLIIIAFSSATEANPHPDLLLFVVTGGSLNWSTAEYSYLISFEYFAMGVTLFVIVPCLIKFLKLSDFDIMIIGLICRVIFSVIVKYVNQSWIMYILVFIWTISGAIRNSIRSILSKMVNKNDLGKLFSLISCVEIVSKFIGPLVYLNIYSATIDIDKWIVFYVMSAIGVINLVLVVAVKIRYQKPSEDKEKLKKTNVDEEAIPTVTQKIEDSGKIAV